MTVKQLDRSIETREQIKLELRQRIQQTLEFTKNLPPQNCPDEIRQRLWAIQEYCKTVGKTFIVVEKRITCDQFGLGGFYKDTATLFHGPNEDASVAICVTDAGSLLHRNDSPWRIYRNCGDVTIQFG